MILDIFSARSYSTFLLKIQVIGKQKHHSNIALTEFLTQRICDFLLFYISRLWINEYIKYIEQHYMISLNIFKDLNLFFENCLGAISGILYFANAINSMYL